MFCKGMFIFLNYGRSLQFQLTNLLALGSITTLNVAKTGQTLSYSKNCNSWQIAVVLEE